MEVLTQRAEIIKQSPDFKNKIQTILFEEYETKQMTKSQIDIIARRKYLFWWFP